MLLFVCTTTRKRFVIFTCRYFKLSWNTTALSQSNCRNFSCRTIIVVIELRAVQFWSEIIIVIIVIWNWTRARSSDYKIMLKEQANKPICTPLSRRSITIAVNPLLYPGFIYFLDLKTLLRAWEGVERGYTAYKGYTLGFTLFAPRGHWNTARHFFAGFQIIFMINEFMLLTPRFKEDIDSDHTETGLLTEATLILRRPSSFAVPSLLFLPSLSHILCAKSRKKD